MFLVSPSPLSPHTQCPMPNAQCPMTNDYNRICLVLSGYGGVFK
ncbi:hypothetical protein [Nostoc linckia]|nr:hypothetical protein [Nostoc linckia]